MVSLCYGDRSYMNDLNIIIIIITILLLLLLLLLEIIKKIQIKKKQFILNT